MRCLACGSDQPPENNYCEDCGTRLAPTVAANGRPSGPSGGACAWCGAGPEAIDGDGFCGRCGLHRVALARDYVEVVVSPRLAGVSDRGKRHHRNEDALALASAVGGDALVVCDGVSSSQNPDDAATAAAAAACAALVDGLGASVAELEALIQGAIRSARAAVEAVRFVPTDAANPPETTIVLAIRSGRRLAVGWIGDSRAYYLGTEGIRPLTRDHSWAVEVVATGEMTAAEAFRAPQSHAVTRTLGGPTESEVDESSFAVFDAPDGPGLLLLCSDGLWNYAPEPEQIAELVRAQPTGADALAMAQGLVDFARDRGGHDNITVAVLML